jgi:hypothetical protein
MVTFTVNDAAGYYILGAGPSVTKAIAQGTPGGSTGYFFTSSTIYNASMFGLRDVGGDWLGTLFYGRTTIDADGQAGFIPDAQIEGEVRGLTVDAFALRYVTSHASSQALTHAIFAGDDTLISNRVGGLLAGRGGDDLIIGVAGAACDLEGGGGDDVLHSFAGDLSSHAVSGDGGDDFIFMSDALLRAKGGGGVDTFFFERVPASPSDVDYIYSFQSDDRFQFDPGEFSALAGGFTADNFIHARAAADADDFIVFFQGYLYYDPDGNGPEAQIALALLDEVSRPVRWQNIFVSDVVPVAGDPGSATTPAHHEAHAWQIHAGLHATGLLP